jgi:hypothetical protein
MGSSTNIYLFGSFQKKLEDPNELPIQLDLIAPTSLIEILYDLKIPPDKVQLVMVNHRAFPQDSTIHPGDRLSLFPKEYPVFADWKDLRST